MGREGSSQKLKKGKGKGSMREEKNELVAEGFKMKGVMIEKGKAR